MSIRKNRISISVAEPILIPKHNYKPVQASLENTEISGICKPNIRSFSCGINIWQFQQQKM
jgi:hypothetical protein